MFCVAKKKRYHQHNTGSNVAYSQMDHFVTNTFQSIEEKALASVGTEGEP